MTKRDNSIVKFNRGEVDENFLARSDVERLQDTASQMVNWLPLRLGPMIYRPGTQYLGSAKSAASNFMVPFLASNDESVILEFYQTSANPSVDGFRVWDDGSLLSRTGTSDTITNGTFSGNITGWTDGSDAGGSASYDSTTGDAKLSGNGAGDYGAIYQSLTVTTSAKRTLLIKVSGPEVECLIGTDGQDSADIFGGVLKRGQHSLTFTPSATPVTITFRHGAKWATYVESVAYEAAGTFSLEGSFFPDTSTNGAVIKTLQYWQSADVMFLCSSGYSLEEQAYPLVRVERRGTESWSMTIPEIWDGPFGPINTTQTTLTPGATSGDTTLTASADFFTDSTKFVGRVFKLVHGSTEGIGVITSVTSSTVAAIRVRQAFGDTTATADWYPGLWARYQSGPTAPGIYEGRLWLAGGGRADGSVSDAYDSFDASLEGDSKAIGKPIGFGPVQIVNWISPGNTLVVGTQNEEIRVGSNAFQDAITASNARLTSIANEGSARIRPERDNNALYQVQRASKRILELTNLAAEDGATVNDLMILHPDIASAGIIRIARTKNPEPRIYAVLGDGTAISCLFDRSEGIIGWSHIEIGGSTTIIDVAVLPDNAEDEVYFLVQRGGTTYVERLAKVTEAVGGSTSRHYDSHVYAASPGATMTGLGHLNGKTVYIWADGRERGSGTPSSGSLTLPDSGYTNVVVGLRHTAEYKSNRIGQYTPKDVLTDRKRIFKLGLAMRNVALSTIQYGPDSSTLSYLPDVDQGAYAPTTEPLLVGSSADSSVTLDSVADSVRGENGGTGYLYVLDGGFPFLVAVVSSGTNEIESHSFDGSDWSPSGTALSVTSQQEPCIAALTPTRIAMYDTGFDELRAYDYNGSTWVLKGSGLSLTTSGFDYAAIAALSSTRVALTSATGTWLRTYDFDGTNWSLVGNSKTVSPGHGAIAALSSSRVVLAVSTTQFQTYDFDGTDWAAAGNAFTFTTSSQERSFAALSSTRMVAHFYNGTNWGIQAYDFDGTDWTTAGNRLALSADKRWISALSATRIATVATGDEMEVYDFDGTDWSQTGNTYTSLGSSGTCDIAALTFSVAVSGIEPGGKLSIISLADPTSVSEVGSVSSAYLAGGGHLALNQDSTYAYVGSAADVLVAIDVSDVTAPSIAGTFGSDATVTDITDIEFETEYVAVASSSNTSIALFSVADPTAITKVATVSDASLSNVVDMELAGNSLAVASAGDSSFKLVTIKGIKSSLVSATNFGGIASLTTKTGLVFTISETNNILAAIDVSDTWNPVVIDTLTDATNFDNVTSITTEEDYAFVATSDGKITIVDIGDPSAMSIVGTYNGSGSIGAPASITVVDGVVYVLDTASSTVFALDFTSSSRATYDNYPFEFDGSYEVDSRIYLQATGPATVLGITYDVDDTDN